MHSLAHLTDKERARLRTRFEAHIARRENGCWEYTGYRHPQGYGVAFVGPYRFRTHRLSWFYANGPIPERIEVCHRCDNPSCVNPDHLFLGTHADNMADMRRKGRNKGRGNRGVNARCGERVPTAKLTEAIVREIRAEYREVGTPAHILADRYGVHFTSIYDVINRVSWRHVPD